MMVVVIVLVVMVIEEVVAVVFTGLSLFWYSVLSTFLIYFQETI